jgi:hypothetical protein
MLWESCLPARYLAAASLVRQRTIDPVNMYSRFFEYLRRNLSACFSISEEMPESLKTEIATPGLSSGKFLAQTAAFEKAINSPADSNRCAHSNENLFIISP